MGSEVASLKESLALLKTENETTSLLLKTKEEKVQSLTKELRALVRILSI